ncbi:MAG: dipeptidase PepE, partial [Bacteroidetes bacterium]|nr:dipeptidase PepE [Bacteroidota bacterium]
ETLADRLGEFIELNRDAVVAGMPEGTAMRIENGRIAWLGSKALRIFRYAEEPQDLPLDADLGWLLGA